MEDVIFCDEKDRFMINSSNSVDEIIKKLGDFEGTREIWLGNEFLASGIEDLDEYIMYAILSDGPNDKPAYKAEFFTFGRTHWMGLRFTNIETNEEYPIYNYGPTDEATREYFLAFPNHRSGGHCIRSVNREELDKWSTRIFTICRMNVLVDRDIEAYTNATFVEIDEAILNDAAKALDYGLYGFYQNAYKSRCSSGSIDSYDTSTYPFEIETAEDLKIHAELRKRLSTLRNAIFRLNIIRHPNGYFIHPDGRLVEIDLSLYTNCDTNLFRLKDLLTMSVTKEPDEAARFFFRRRSKYDDVKYYSACFEGH
ncbi:Oidioi.mRNA.OKI2018_I69.chr2.g5334.t1.cds [Oikopleura dioica]|uniref:Oidioi.mRNA.OKI2018_I69.chr2.g5334.t1.cds n=1 Tax=Oikopleura dioica TaxID=34765 RepID=A0ABN7T000_OIKDI|nr:Oidioi.mRNA.OKI2018_I69.chr2.g5334.t1.cds [Oikopleura dioica]